jgi:D-alanine transaminase
MQVYLNGEYVDKQRATVSVDDRGFLFGDGIYEVVRAYQGRLFALDEHLARMRDGLRAIRIDGVDAGHFADVCRRLLSRNDMEHADAVIYMQVTRGTAPRRHWFPEAGTPATVYASASPVLKKGDAASGVAVITAPDIRWARCDIKSVNLLPNCMAQQRAREQGGVEAILVRDGVALEGTSSSFFAVIDGEVRTAPKSNYILPSITRQIALDVAAELGIPWREAPVLVEDLASAEELFLAGTTVEIMPIVRVDGHPVGSGRPGPLTDRLMAKFRERTRSPETARV